MEFTATTLCLRVGIIVLVGTNDVVVEMDKVEESAGGLNVGLLAATKVYTTMMALIAKSTTSKYLLA